MKKKKNFILNNPKSILLKILISLSMFFLIIIFSNYNTTVNNSLIWILISSFIGGILLLYLLFKSKKEIIINKKSLIFSFFISTYAMEYFLDLRYNKFSFILETLKLSRFTNIAIFGIGILAIPACMFLSYLFLEKIFPKVKKFFQKLDKIEKRYLILVGVISAFFTIIICFMTTAFTNSTYNNSIVYDIIYTSDSGIFADGDAFIDFSHVENDIRQPFFGVFALPFGLIAHFLSHFLFIQNGQGYYIIMLVIQFLLNAITTIMLGRLLKLDDKYKTYFYLLFSFSFPYLIFGFVLEQYSIALFYLILSIYISFNYKGINYSYIAATGTLLTSGIIFPLITKFKSLKQWITDVFKCGLAFIMVFIFSGQFIQILNLKYKISILSNFCGYVPFSERIFRFSNFISSIFIGTTGEIVNKTSIPAYRLIDPTEINYIGLGIFILLIISFILNRKEFMAKISFLWILFSIVVLVLIGWGQPENGLILYGLYFSWSYLILYFMLIKKIFKNIKFFKLAMYISIIFMSIFNFIELFKIVGFTIKFY